MMPYTSRFLRGSLLAILLSTSSHAQTATVQTPTLPGQVTPKSYVDGQVAAEASRAIAAEATKQTAAQVTAQINTALAGLSGGGSAYTLPPASASVLGGVTYGTTAGTAVQGNDPRLPTGAAGAPNGAAVLNSSGVLPAGVIPAGTGGTTLTLGTTGTTAAAGNDSRITGAATATALTAETTRATAAEATLTTSEAAKQTAAQVQAAITAALAALPTSHATSTVTITATSPTAITATTVSGQTAVTVSSTGAITVPTGVNVLFLVNSTSSTPIVLTLPAGQFDRQEVEFKRIAGGPFTISASMDAASGTSSITTGSSGVVPFDDIAERWSASLATYLVH